MLQISRISAACCTGSSIFGLSQYRERCGLIAASSKKTRDVPGGDLVDNSLFLRRSRELARRPVRDWQTELRGLLARKRDDLRELQAPRPVPSGRGRGWGAIVVAEHVHDELREVIVIELLSLGARKHPHHVGPSVPPTAHALRIDAKRFCLPDTEHALGGQQHDPRALDEAILCSR